MHGPARTTVGDPRKGETAIGELDGRVAIITGAGRLRGIGRATAVHLARLGADILVTGTARDPAAFPPDEIEAGWKGIKGTAEQVRAEGRRAVTLVSDVTNRQQVQAMVEVALGEFGRIDILVNNAAYPIGEDRVPLLELDPDVFKRVVDVKVTGSYLCTKAVARVLVDQGQGGKIVNVSSVAGKRGEPYMLAYGAATFAMVGMTQSLAKEFGPHGINVNAVCPGDLDTARTDEQGRGEEWRKMEAGLPLGRAGTDDEVGGLIAFLCTEAASWITGQSINIDGRLVMEH